MSGRVPALPSVTLVLLAAITLLTSPKVAAAHGCFTTIPAHFGDHTFEIIESGTELIVTVNVNTGCTINTSTIVATVQTPLQRIPQISPTTTQMQDKWKQGPGGPCNPPPYLEFCNVGGVLEWNGGYEAGEGNWYFVNLWVWGIFT